MPTGTCPAHRPAGHCCWSQGGLTRPAGTALRCGPLDLRRVSHPCSRPYADVMGSPRLWVELVRPASLPAGDLTQTKFDRAADSPRPSRRRRWVPGRRRARGAIPEPDTARPRPAVVHHAGRRRHVVRSAGLRRAVVATALGARRRAHLSHSRDVLEFGDACRAPGAAVAGRAPPGPVVAARRCAVDPVPPALRRLQPHHRPGDGAGAGHSPGPRRHRLGNVHPGPTTAAPQPAGACPAGGGRSAAVRRAGADGRAHPDRPGDARRARPPDLADGVARRRARGPARPAARAGTRDRRAAALDSTPGPRGAAWRDRRATGGTG